MPKFAKGSDEAKKYMAELRSRKGKGKGVLDQLTKAGTKAGQPFDTAIGLNPFTLGYDIGKDYIAPELMKVLPPKGRGISGKGKSKKGKGADEVFYGTVGGLGGLILLLLLFAARGNLLNEETDEEHNLIPTDLPVAEAQNLPIAEIIRNAENLAGEVNVRNRRRMINQLTNFLESRRGRINLRRIQPINEPVANVVNEAVSQAHALMNVLGNPLNINNLDIELPARALDNLDNV